MKRRPVLDLFPDEIKRMQMRFRILRHVRVDPQTGCWRWTGKMTRSKRGSNYPLITMRVPGYKTPRNLIATRVSLEVFVGPPPAGREAAHDPVCCPHTDCVNHAHLRWATRSENELDKRHPRRMHVRELAEPIHQVLGRMVDGETVPF